MKIKSLGAGQKAQSSQGITQAADNAGQSSAEFSLRQEFQAALATFAGQAPLAGTLSQVSLATFEVAQSILTVNASQQASTIKERDFRDTDYNGQKSHKKDRDSAIANTNDSVITQDSKAGSKESEDKDPSDNKDAKQADLATQPGSAPSVSRTLQTVTQTSTAAAATVANQNEVKAEPQPTIELAPPSAQASALLGQNLSGDRGAPSSEQSKLAPTNVAQQGSAATSTTATETQSSSTVDSAAATQGITGLNAAIGQQGSVHAAGQQEQAVGNAIGVVDAAATTAESSAIIASVLAALTKRLTAQTAASGELVAHINQNSISDSGLAKHETSALQALQNVRGESALKGEFLRNSEQTARTPRFQPSKILERVEATLKEAARSRDGKTISFRLDPPELGTLKVDVSIRDGALHARISTENSTVAGILREKAYELQSMLRKLGLEVERVSVSVHENSTPHGGEFSQARDETGNSGSQNKGNDREFNNFGAGSDFASGEQQGVLSGLGSKGLGHIDSNGGWVA